MQEDIESRTVNLAVSTTKLTARTVISAVQTYLKHRKEVKAEKAAEKAQSEPQKPTGKQTVKELIGQNQGVTNIDIAKTDLRGFESVARKYGIDYAIRKDASAQPPKYLVFFKARDTDAMTAAFNEYAQKALQKQQRPSVLKELRDIAVKVASLPAKVITRMKQRDRNR